MFKFNFNNEEDNERRTDSEKDADVIQWLQSEEIIADKQIQDIDNLAVHAKMFICDDVEIGHIIPSDALSYMNNFSNDVIKADTQHSDLVTAKYEGGLKVWECTSDILEYFVREKVFFNLKNIKVLDLGCGAGLIGIYAFMNGAAVTFQDYNKEVIECVTIPNVLLNIDDERREKELTKCRFFSGDWASFNQLLENTEKYDIICTSETIYNPNNYDKLIEIFLKRLTSNGTVYLAAKSYYFGVGGGTRQFEKAVEQNGTFKCEVIWKSLGGIQREILKLTRS